MVNRGHDQPKSNGLKNMPAGIDQSFYRKIGQVTRSVAKPSVYLKKGVYTAVK